MSFNGWIDEQLTAHAACMNGIAVYYTDGTNITPLGGRVHWEDKADNLDLYPVEIVNTMFQPEGIQYIQTNGIYIGKTRMRFIRVDEEERFMICAAKVPDDHFWEPSGAFLQATERGTLVICTYGPHQSKNTCSVAAMKVIDGITDAGY